jgi:acyl-CoA dehydrogenase
MSKHDASTQHFFAERILDRDIGTIRGDTATWRALEDRLAKFCAELRERPADERDVYAATRDYVQRLADAEFLKLVVPGRYGGAHEAVSATAVCLARQWFGRESGALDTAFVMQGLGSYPVVLAGSDELRAELMPRVCNGDALCAFALTEPGAGSDVSGMQTRAVSRSDGSATLNGQKTFISNAGLANSYTIFARESEDSPEGKARYSAFWMPGDAKGLRIKPIEVIAPHPIGTLELDGVEIPPQHRLGAPGDGLKIALGNLDQFRATVGAAALGMADRAMEVTLEHLSQRVQFGRPLAKQQGLRFALADCATDMVAAQLLVYRAAAARDAGTAGADEPAMGKLFATEAAQRVIDRAVQSLGGLGVTVGQVPERLYREVRALRIYEGTSEIQKLVIARALFGAPGRG